VVGDDRQLPPTTFFERTIDVDDDYSESVTIDLESILGLCVAKGIPQRMLRWHYRSQHESLITVSNYEFYDDKLVVFPSPDKEKKEVGLVYHYLPQTVYGRGKNRANVGEATKVAEAVMNHAKSCPSLTLGVATFSISQMEAIRDQLEILRRQDPANEDFFRSHPEEPFFIKNLENVQGDERDVIFISVGYGRTAEGRVSMNFGPINHEGGERRLNVLITRARKRCEIFTNLKADDIDLSRTKARGVEVLKRFLKFAETGHLDIPLPSGREAESPFEEAVASELRKLGYHIEHQVGSRGYFIDLAVIDEERPGRYLLGIECDGATYHSARSARDRDRLRQEVLENLGWRIHRIWSTDWFRNPQREIKFVKKSIEAAKSYYATNELSDNSSAKNMRRQPTNIERLNLRDQENPALKFEEYEAANLQISHYEMLRDFSMISNDSMLAMVTLIKDVVLVESPVHKDVVLRRFVTCAGVRRIGRRIREAFDLGLEIAIKAGLVSIRGEFLWQNDMKIPKLRSRKFLPNSERNISLIAPEEIALAILEVVKSSYGIQRDSIPNIVCKLFGFMRVTGEMNNTVDNIIEKLFKNDDIIEEGDYVSISKKRK